MLSNSEVDDFQREVLDFYHQHQRNLPWRHSGSAEDFDPYRIMVSEIMLQQTQVPRVIEKYAQFLEVFPTIADLASAPLSDVLFVWQGLGYNRRGRFLREAAIMTQEQYGGRLPKTVAELVTLPGIGINTASAILVYAYNQPLVFIETNIRTVYLHCFFKNVEDVTDAQILELVAQTLDSSDPRNWYWALMDYGTYIKKTYGNPNLRSKHYVKQSTFKGSKRQIRGQLLRDLSAGPQVESEMTTRIDDPRTGDVISDLIKEHLIERKGDQLQIAP